MSTPTDKTDATADDGLRKTRENLRRLMAKMGLTIEQVAEKSGLDRRTIKGILDGTNTPQLRTIGRLAKGLEVSSDEFFLDPAQLLYRRFDQRTNPLVEEILQSHPEVFADWASSDFDELHSRVGCGGPLTPEGALAAAREMNAKRRLQEKFSVLLESSQAEVIAGIVDLFYRQVVDDRDEHK
ncbi:MAG: helix-turn-helix domain-containing protein [Planctomycetota bacterium]|jgi:transcriptional regulator with XRE-family HTH domain